MTAEERRAERFDEAELLNEPEFEDELRSGVVIVWLALTIVAGAAIAVLWWTFR